MEFLRNYDITEYVKKYHDSLGYGESLAKYYVCEDVWDFHIYRVIVGYNAEYDEDDSAKLIEQNDISKEDVKDEFEDLLDEVFNVSDIRNFPSVLEMRKDTEHYSKLLRI